MHGKRIGFLAVVLTASTLCHQAAAQQSETMFRIRVEQVEEKSDAVQRGEWRCASDVLRRGKCRRSVPLMIDGSLQPVLVTLRAQTTEGNTELERASLVINVEQGGWRVVPEIGKRGLKLDERSRLAREIELWETRERARGMVHDLLYRKPTRRLATMALIIEKQAD